MFAPGERPGDRAKNLRSPGLTDADDSDEYRLP